MEGYDKPQYVNVQYPWDGHEAIEPGEIPTQFNPVASYVKYFTVPENMQDKRLFVSFQGVESGFALWCNGSYVGYSEDTFTPSEFELTSYLKEGETSWLFRYLSGHPAVGVRIRISSVSQVFSEMCICTAFLTRMSVISESRRY